MYSLYLYPIIDKWNNTAGMFAQKEKYKWEAWNSNKGRTKEECAQDYISGVNAHLAK